METTTRNADLPDLANLLQKQHDNKLDVVVPASQVRAKDGNLIVPGVGEPVITIDGVTPAGPGVFRPTAVCDGGIAAKLDIPSGYLRRMRDNAIDLYDANINGWLDRAGDAKYLVRTFRDADGGPGIARAFLSNSYRPIDNLDALVAALDGIRAAGVEVKIDSCDLTDRKMYVTVRSEQVQAMAPTLLAGYRSPFTGNRGADNPTVFAGFVISNSEVGAGAFSITPRVVAEVCGNGMTISRDAMRKQHLGEKLEAGVFEWSADTQVKNLALITAQARDAVTAFLSHGYLAAAVRGLERMSQKPVEKAEETVQTVTTKLRYPEERRSLVLDHFIRGGDLTCGGVMHAVTSAAQTLDDADDAHAMEDDGIRALELAYAL